MRKIFLCFLLLLTTAILHAQSDQDTDNNVMSALGSAKSLQNVAITTATANGVVTLTGNVSNQSQRELADLLAGHAAGVKRVIDDLTVTAAQTESAPAPPPPSNNPARDDASAGDLLSDGSIAAPATPPKPTGPITDVDVDQKCRFLEADASKPDKQPRFRKDNHVCNIEGSHYTRGYVEVAENGVIERRHVQIQEQTFVLQNITAGRLAFLVHMTIPKGWQIDSTPLPAQTVDGVSIFRVITEPGELQKLHVGYRRY